MWEWSPDHAMPLPLRVNVGCGPAEERVLLTGLHAVADIYCENCKTTLGWKYVSVPRRSQQRPPEGRDGKVGGIYRRAL